MGMGPFKINITRLGGRGLTKNMTKCDVGGEGLTESKSHVTTSKKIGPSNRIVIDL